MSSRFPSLYTPSQVLSGPYSKVNRTSEDLSSFKRVVTMHCHSGLITVDPSSGIATISLKNTFEDVNLYQLVDIPIGIKGGKVTSSTGLLG